MVGGWTGAGTDCCQWNHQLKHIRVDLFNLCLYRRFSSPFPDRLLDMGCFSLTQNCSRCGKYGSPFHFTAFLTASPWALEVFGKYEATLIDLMCFYCSYSTFTPPPCRILFYRDCFLCVLALKTIIYYDSCLKIKCGQLLPKPNPRPWSLSVSLEEYRYSYQFKEYS